MPETIRMITIKVMLSNEEVDCILVEETELLRLLKVENPCECEIFDAEISDVEKHAFG